MYRTIPQLHLGAEIEPVKDGTKADFGKKKNSWDQPHQIRIRQILENPGFSSKFHDFRVRKPFKVVGLCSYFVDLFYIRVTLMRKKIGTKKFFFVEKKYFEKKIWAKISFSKKIFFTKGNFWFFRKNLRFFFQNIFSPRKKIFFWFNFFYHRNLINIFPAQLTRTSGRVCGRNDVL